MKSLLISLVLCLAFAVSADAASLLWDRNTEADMDHYNVYACFTSGCTVLQNSAMKQGPSIAQTPIGSVPSWTLPTGQEGKVAVSAVDNATNESGLSVALPFDAKAPSIPVNPRIQ